MFLSKAVVLSEFGPEEQYHPIEFLVNKINLLELFYILPLLQYGSEAQRHMHQDHTLILRCHIHCQEVYKVHQVYLLS